MNIYGFDDNGRKVKIGEYKQVLPIGGTIFYTDSTADGVYKLYDANLSETSVLADAMYYEVITAGTKDKYYVADTTTGWVDSKTWGYSNITTGATTDAIGSGKTNTATILGIEDTSYSASNSIFTYLSGTQNAGTGVGGCKDWFVGSKAELDQLKSTSVMDWANKQVWSSVESLANTAHYWDGSRWYSLGTKSENNSVVFLRAF